MDGRQECKALSATTLSMNRTLGGGGGTSEVGAAVLALPACTGGASLGILGFKGISLAMLQEPPEDETAKKGKGKPAKGSTEKQRIADLLAEATAVRLPLCPP